MTKTIKEVQQEIDIFLKQRGWFPNDKIGRYYTMTHMMEELGEVARCVSLIESKRGNWLENRSDNMRDDLKIEIGDLLYHVFKLENSTRVFTSG